MNTLWANILTACAILIYGYLLGSIQNGVVIGKLFFHKDPRDYGSHNSGGTNSGRVLGKKIGLLVIVLDFSKTIVAFWSVWAILRFSGLREAVAASDPNGLGLWDDGVFYNWLVLVGVSLGHCWPIYAKFKGGKTVACFMACVGGTSWFGVLLCNFAFFSLFLKKKVVSFASLFSGLIITVVIWTLALLSMLLPWDSSIMMWNFGFGGGAFYGWEMASVITFVYGLLVIRHHANIKRLAEGTEKPINY
jgi:glycerol-3-phosphate acyltransferase PlsY